MQNSSYKFQDYPAKNEGIAEGLAEGEAKGIHKTAVAMLRKGVDFEFI